METYIPNDQDLLSLKRFLSDTKKLPNLFFTNEDTKGYYVLDDEKVREETISKFLKKRECLIKEVNELTLKIHVFIKNRYGVDSSAMTSFQKIAFFEEQTSLMSNFFNERKNRLWKSGKHSLISLLMNLIAQNEDLLKQGKYRQNIEKEIKEKLKVRGQESKRTELFWWKFSTIALILISINIILLLVNFSWVPGPTNERLTKILLSLSSALFCASFLWPPRWKYFIPVAISLIATAAILMKNYA